MKLSRDELLSALNAINPACERTHWIAVGYACYEAGLEFDDWDRWSARADDAYPGKRQCQVQWRSITRTASGPAGANVAPLIALAQREGWEAPRPSRQRDNRPQRLSNATPENRATPKRQAPRDLSDAERDTLIASILAASATASARHPYLTRKDVQPDGLLCIATPTLKGLLNYVPRCDAGYLEGELLVAPLCNLSTGKVEALEFIDPSGRKSGIAGVKRRGLAWNAVGGKIEERLRTAHSIGIAEGVATGASIEGALRLLPNYRDAVVLSASSGGNIPTVTEHVRSLNPDAEIIVFGDAGNGSQHAIDAANAIGERALIPPPELLPEGGKDWNDVCRHLGYSGLAQHFDRLLRDPTHVPMPRTLDDLLPLDYILPGLPVSGVGMIAGPGAVGKTFLIMQLGISIVFGRSYLGDALPGGWYAADLREKMGRPLRVALLLGEDDAPVIQRRLWDIAEVYGLAERERNMLDNHLRVHSLVGHDLRIVQSERYGQIGIGPFLHRLRRFCGTHDLVVIDPLVRLHDSQENDNSAASALMNVLSRIGRETGCSIVLLHHFGKSGGRDYNAARGASAFVTSVRWQANLMPLTADELAASGLDVAAAPRHVRLELTKANYIAPQPALRFERVAHGVLRVGDALPSNVTSLPANAAASAARRAAPTRAFAPPDDDPFGEF